MTRSVVQIRVEEDVLDRWRAAAKADLVSLSTFVRDSVEVRLTGAPRPSESARSMQRAGRSSPVEARLGDEQGRPIRPDAVGLPPMPPLDEPAARAVARPVAATSRRCAARTPAGAYCKTCGAVHR